MNKTAAHNRSPLSVNNGTKPAKDAGVARSEFVAYALSMSWQLAVVVLVPIVGGYKLDQHFKTLPVLTIVGFVLAMTGMFVVLWRILNMVNEQANKNDAKSGGKS